nr:LytTR family DNA-binding domain-containing protein [uncultured Steroidobacter sp.]
MKYLASAEQTSVHPNLRAQTPQAQRPACEAREVLPASTGPFTPVSSAREFHEVAPLTIHKDMPSRRWRHSPRLVGERAHRFHFLDAPSIDYLQVDGNYVTIHVGEDRYLTRATLKYLSDVLTPFDFMRIDRSVLINLQQVDYIERLESGRFGFQLRRGRYLVSNRERSGAILRLLRSSVR